jgi:uncharacterized protein YidB (DUF937 family)
MRSACLTTTKGEAAMGFLVQIVKTVTSRLFGGESQGDLMDQVMGIVNNPETGGLAGPVETLKNNGLGDEVSSWIGSGENKLVSGEAIANALGSENVQEIAGKLGMSGSEVATGLAALLPGIIDRLTPDGKLPEKQLN